MKGDRGVLDASVEKSLLAVMEAEPLELMEPQESTKTEKNKKCNRNRL